MNSNGLLRKHWFQVGVHFLVDALIFILCYSVSAWVIFRLGFNEDPGVVLQNYWISYVAAAFTYSCFVYITGQYTPHNLNRTAYRRSFLLGCCIVLSSLVFVALAYATTARPLGRGYMALSNVFFAALAYVHHSILIRAIKTERERVAYLVTGKFDEDETRIFSEIGLKHLHFAGVISGAGYQPSGKNHLLGTVEDLAEICAREKIDRVLVTGRNLTSNSLARNFCKLRYSGVTVMSLVNLCEEVDQFVPIELLTTEWLLNASGEPHLLYIKKVKRLGDILVSAAGLVLSLPILLLGILLVKLSSRGPVFYRQTRSGRFGKPFSMIKLRTMCVDAEKDGAQWAQGGVNGSRDPRVTWFGGFLRRYRIDEIPQLWNVLRGDMSFVGPRPERPEMIKSLAKDIPYYEERMMVQPGITGWAQVNYPYGATVLDARRKLEYDLYYLKNMGLLLDLFILLDTVRAVIFGGGKLRSRRVAPDAMGKMEEIIASESRAGTISPLATPLAPPTQAQPVA